jgi:hypothetical protein
VDNYFASDTNQITRIQTSELYDLVMFKGVQNTVTEMCPWAPQGMSAIQERLQESL